MRFATVQSPAQRLACAAILVPLLAAAQFLVMYLPFATHDLIIQLLASAGSAADIVQAIRWPWWLRAASLAPVLLALFAATACGLPRWCCVVPASYVGLMVLSPYNPHAGLDDLPWGSLTAWAAAALLVMNLGKGVARRRR